MIDLVYFWIFCFCFSALSHQAPASHCFNHRNHKVLLSSKATDPSSFCFLMVQANLFLLIQMNFIIIHYFSCRRKKATTKFYIHILENRVKEVSINACFMKCYKHESVLNFLHLGLLLLDLSMGHVTTNFLMLNHPRISEINHT